MTDNPSISARTIEALTAIATGLHDIADAVREFPGRVDGAGSGETPNNSECSCAGQVGAPVEHPQIVTETGPGATQADSAGRGASGGLGEQLRALVAEPDPEESQYESVDVAALVGLADEAHRLEVHARVIEQSLRTARTEGDGARIKAEQWKARYEETRDANRRVLEVAQWFRGQGLVGYARKVEEAVGGMEGALNADHPLGKVIGVIRECGTEHYKTGTAP